VRAASVHWWLAVHSRAKGCEKTAKLGNRDLDVKERFLGILVRHQSGRAQLYVAVGRHMFSNVDSVSRTIRVFRPFCRNLEQNIV
jgi:hypothetical protein